LPNLEWKNLRQALWFFSGGVRAAAANAAIGAEA
jgi:hypothetical protein